MYVISYSARIAWVPDGAGPMTVPEAQSYAAIAGVGLAAGPVQVPGGDSPSSGNITTACTSIGSALATAFNANLTQIQGWSTGGN